MRPEVEAEILAAFSTPRTDTPKPLEEPLAGDVYGSSEMAAREERLVFSKAWLPIARVDELAEAGAFATQTLGGTPVVAVRGDDGKLRVLVNVCRHRGAQILRESCGVAQSLRCPYHAFTYSLDGTLTACPHPESLRAEAQPGALSLPELPSATWAGWVWTSLDPNAAPLESFLGAELRDELTNWPLAECRTVMRREVPCAFDWKIGVEAFLEPYHVPAIHTRSAHPMVDFRGMAIRDLGLHSRMALPFRIPDAYAPDGILGTSAHAAGVGWFPTLNRAQQIAHHVYLVFPCTILMLFPSHLLALRFLPGVGVGTCHLRYELLAAPPTSEASAAWLDALKPSYEKLVQEDLDNLPWIQKGVASGTIPTMELSSYESRIALFRRSLSERGA